jgi:hypothetical protein
MSTAAVLAAFALTLPYASVVKSRIDPNAQAVMKVVTAQGALPWPGLTAAERILHTEKLLLDWALFESGWDHTALGDHGRACGVLQVHWKYVPESCTVMRSSPEAGYRVGYRVLKKWITVCGGIESGLGAYSTGHCGGKPTKVKYRLSFL